MGAGKFEEPSLELVTHSAKVIGKAHSREAACDLETYLYRQSRLTKYNHEHLLPLETTIQKIHLDREISLLIFETLCCHFGCFQELRCFFPINKGFYLCIS